MPTMNNNGFYGCNIKKEDKENKYIKRIKYKIESQYAKKFNANKILALKFLNQTTKIFLEFYGIHLFGKYASQRSLLDLYLEEEITNRTDSILIYRN